MRDLSEVEERGKRIQQAGIDLPKTIALIHGQPYIEKESMAIAIDPQAWNITLPAIYERGQMNFSPQDYENFKRVVELGSKVIDKSLERYSKAASDLVSRKPELVVGSPEYFWTPPEIYARTYALSTFLDEPVLGKSVHFETNYHQDDKTPSNKKESMWLYFEILPDEEKGFVPVFLTECWWARGGVLQEIKDEIKKDFRLRNSNENLETIV